MASILVLGAGGMAGSMISKYLSWRGHNMVPMFRKDFDALSETTKWPNIKQYDYVINCIGLIKQKSSDDDLLYALNSAFPNKLVNECKRLIHISSDCVFSGNLPEGQSYNINDIPDATDAYGKSKAKGEVSDVAMILRTSIIGPSNDSFGLFEWFRSTNDNPVKGFSNHWWSGITTLELAKIIDLIIASDQYSHGLAHIATSPISKYLLLCQINEVFDLRKPIEQCKSSTSINRVLDADSTCKDIYFQLKELKKFIGH